MNYREKIQEKLADYKKEKFPTLYDGCYRGKYIYPHILPYICGNLNLIEIYRNDFLKDKLSKIKFHQYFHHLNSSQAMCINFFFPLIKEKKLDIILDELEIKNESVNYDSVQFEKESNIDNKNRQRPTNFDFYFRTNSEKQFYFEIKYTEDKFGNAKKDDEHKKKYSDIYNKVAEKVIKKEYNNEDYFLDNYQIMRNLIHIDDNSYVVFVIPKNNEKVYNTANNVNNFIIEKYKNNVKILTWEKLYEITENKNFTCKLNKHFIELKQKYKL